MANILDRLESLRVKHVMTRDVVVLVSDQPAMAALSFLNSRDVTTAPVVAPITGECVGVWSLTDYLRRGQDAGDNASVGEQMTQPVTTIAADAGLLEAAEILNNLHLHRLFVLNERQKPVGVVSTMDVVAALLNAVAESRTSRD